MVSKHNIIHVAAVLLLGNFSLMADEHSIDFTFNLNSPPDTPEAVVSVALESDCDSILSANGDSNLGAVCGFVADAQPEQIAEIAEELSAKANTSTNTVTTKTPSLGQTRDIGLRLSALRSTSRNASKTNFRAKPRKNPYSHLIFNAQSNDEPGGLLSQRLSGFVNINNVSSEQLENSTEIGYDSNSSGLVLGIDYRLKTATFIGIASQYFRTSADLTDEGSSLKANQIGFTLYGTHFINQKWYVEGTVNSGKQTLDLERRIDLALGAQPIQETAKGDTNSQQLGVSLGTGYDIPLKWGFNSLVSANIAYSSTSIDAYTETNAGDLALDLESQSLTSLTSSVNAYLSRVFSTKYGVLIPQLSMTWIHETETEKQKIAAKFANDNSDTKFIFNTPPPDTNYFIVGADLQMLFTGGRMAFIKYTNVRRLRDKSEFSLAAGYRMEF